MSCTRIRIYNFSLFSKNFLIAQMHLRTDLCDWGISHSTNFCFMGEFEEYNGSYLGGIYYRYKIIPSRPPYMGVWWHFLTHSPATRLHEPTR